MDFVGARVLDVALSEAQWVRGAHRTYGNLQAILSNTPKNSCCSINEHFSKELTPPHLRQDTNLYCPS